MTRVGYLGPPGTFSGEALRADTELAQDAWGELEAVALDTIHDTIVAVQDGRVERAIVPIENSLEGSVDATLDALALDAPDVRIVGETALAVRHCLIAGGELGVAQIETVASHPQVLGQCSRLIRELSPRELVAASSSAEAVRMLGEPGREAWAALGNRLSADIYGCEVLREGVEDHPDNETRFVWLGRAGTVVLAPRSQAGRTSLVFWGRGSESPGWLVRCLTEFASREVNLTRIESRPRRQGMGSYMFFADLEGREHEDGIAAAIDGLREHSDEVRVLGSYAAAVRHGGRSWPVPKHSTGNSGR